VNEKLNVDTVALLVVHCLKDPRFRILLCAVAFQAKVLANFLKMTSVASGEGFVSNE
jgi:hypothetical protein